MAQHEAVAPRGSALEVLRIFLRLGVTSFGGPIAHLGYFRREFVERRAWIGEAAYADLVALCQFLPGPASSQVGFAIGLRRAGLAGALAAWTGFTAPSAALMTAFAYGAAAIGRGALGQSVIHGLKLVAVPIVAQAVLGMARTLAPDRVRASIAASAALVVIFAPAGVGQILAIALGAVAGLILCRPTSPETSAHPFRARASRAPVIAGLIVVGLLFLPGGVVLGRTPVAQLFHAFYSAGALVFGGGHVVLPLLRGQVVQPGWVSPTDFLAGYGAAQAAPGPLFTFAAYLGAMSRVGPGGALGAIVALVAIFLPGLVLVGVLAPRWAALRRLRAANSLMMGVNAAVVGVLALALYDPVWTSAVRGPADFAIALAAFVLLIAWKAPPLVIVAASLAAAVALGSTG